MTIARCLAIAAAVAVLGGDAAQAQEAGRAADRMFERIDADHDGVLTRAEVQAARGRMFDRLDADHDGVLTAAEFAAARERVQQRAAARFSRLAGTPDGRLEQLDRNRDGRVSRDEYVAATSWFDRLDTTGRGVTQAQFAAALSQSR
jgi:Ca2+-binding EF-hand superfamily protein